MNTENISKIVKNLGRGFSKNSPIILTGIAVGGLVTTTVLAIKATPRALSLIDDEVYWRYEESGTQDDFHVWLGVSKDGYTWDDRIKILTNKETIKLTWKCYIPAFGVGVASIGCIIGANSINLRRNAAIASVYSITESALKEYQAKVVDTIGKNKELKIRDEISTDRIKKNPPSTNEVIITGKGDVLCYDSPSGRYFKSDIEKIRRVQNELNRRLITEMFIDLNDFYSELGLSETKLGRDVGWLVDRGLVDINFSTQLSEDDVPCLVLNYEYAPNYYG